MKRGISYAAGLIRQGKLVAFPTETVYGLGANALDREAVERIFRVKGRPSTSPLIVHVDSVEAARGVVSEWPESADVLAKHYWPGPLTLVLPKKPLIPDIVTAGLPTVGVRMPAHPLALELIREAGTPIAAPSANLFAELSATEATHVRRNLEKVVDYILDGGPAPVGIESTVLSLVNNKPLLLRPGMISKPEIEALIGSVGAAGRVENAHPSPGMHKKHYAPSTPLYLVSGARLPGDGRGAYLWIRQPGAAARSIEMPTSAADYAAKLYSTLHEVDGEGWDWIAVEEPPEGEEWAGIADRLKRATTKVGEQAK